MAHDTIKVKTVIATATDLYPLPVSAGGMLGAPEERPAHGEVAHHSGNVCGGGTSSTSSINTYIFFLFVRLLPT